MILLLLQQLPTSLQRAGCPDKLASGSPAPSSPVWRAWTVGIGGVVSRRRPLWEGRRGHSCRPPLRLPLDLLTQKDEFGPERPEQNMAGLQTPEAPGLSLCGLPHGGPPENLLLPSLLIPCKPPLSVQPQLCCVPSPRLRELL